MTPAYPKGVKLLQRPDGSVADHPNPGTAALGLATLRV